MTGRVALLILIVLAQLGLGAGWLRYFQLRADLATTRQTARLAQEQSDANLTHLQTAIPVMVEQAQKSAVATYRRRFPPVACRPGPVGLLPATGSDPAGRAEGPDRLSLAEQLAVAPEFITACATDAAMLDAWREWALRNQLKGQ